MRIYLAGNEEGIPVYRAAFIKRERVASLWSFFKFKIGSVKEDLFEMVMGGGS